jgi:hypothetical protein
MKLLPKPVLPTMSSNPFITQYHDTLYVLSGNNATDRRDSRGLDAVRCARDPNKNP